MRFLAIHVDYFCSKITQKGRSKLVEPYDDPTTEVNEALILLTSVEKGDERAPDQVAERAEQEIVQLASNLKVNLVVLHSFAHLFAELSTPEVAVQLLKTLEVRLRDRGLAVIRTPFGWFNTLEFRAKGHPLSPRCPHHPTRLTDPSPGEQPKGTLDYLQEYFVPRPAPPWARWGDCGV